MHSFRSTPQDITCPHESKSGDRKHWPALNVADIGRSEPGKVVDAHEPENRVARANTTKILCLENSAWRGTESTFLVAYAHVFSKKPRSEIDVFSASAGRRGTNSTRKCVFAQGR